MYTDYYLKFTSEEESKSILYKIEYFSENNVEGQSIPNFQNIDVLGMLYETQEVVDIENQPEQIPIEGWYVNVRVIENEDSTILEPYKVNPEPQNWRRVWA